MTLSVSHVNPPKGFNASVRMVLNEKLLNSLFKHYANENIYLLCGEQYAIPRTGLYVWDNIECWVYNQEKHNYMTLYFKSFEEYTMLMDLIKTKELKISNSIKNKLYKYNPNVGWACYETYSKFDEENLIGYNHYFKQIDEEISSHQKNKQLLKSIGEFKSLSYLLYGIPGTGKTTLIKALSSKYNMDVYIINSIYAKSSNIGSLLNPVKNDTAKQVIVLFEDFDRFIVRQDNKELLGIILNAMDGFDDSDNVIRFFTGNDCSVIYNEKALINRISGKYKFDYPTFEMFRAKLMKLGQISPEPFDDDKVNTFISLIVDKQITLRPFTSYCVRYLFTENNLTNMIDHVNELIE